jgi:hypothetical protein
MQSAQPARSRVVPVTASLVLVLGAAAGLATVSRASSSRGPAVHGVSRVSAAAPPASRVFVIVGENTSLRQLTRKRAPYLVKALRPKSAWLVGYRALPHSSSTGDYIEMTSGQSIRCERNDSNPENADTDKPICHQTVNNLFHQLQRRHISWKDWQESMPHPCAFYDDGVDWEGDVYGAHHNPAIYYDDIEGARYAEDYDMRPKSTCVHNDVPMGTTAPDNTSAFDRQLHTGDVPRFNYIVPNDCENGHDPCGGQNTVGQFDAFLRREVPKILASPAWDSRSVIDITWDEQGDATPHDLQVGNIWYGSRVRPGTYRGSWTHASLLRAVESEFGLRHLHAARTASPIKVWK